MLVVVTTATPASLLRPSEAPSAQSRRCRFVLFSAARSPPELPARSAAAPSGHGPRPGAASQLPRSRTAPRGHAAPLSPSLRSFGVSEPPPRAAHRAKPVMGRGTNQSQTTCESFRRGLKQPLLSRPRAQQRSQPAWKSSPRRNAKNAPCKKRWLSPATSSFEGQGESRWLRSPTEAR